MRALKMIPALFSVWLMTKTFKPTHVVDVVEVKTLYVEAPKIWPTITVTKTVGVPTTKVEPTVPPMTITATTASTLFKDTSPTPPPIPKYTPKPYPFPLPLEPSILSSAYIGSALAAPRFSILDLAMGTLMSIMTAWLLYCFPLLIHIRCIRRVAMEVGDGTFESIVNGIISVKQTCQCLEMLINGLLWLHGRHVLILALLVEHWGFVTSQTLMTYLAIYVVSMMVFCKWDLFKHGVLQDWQIVIAARNEVLEKSHAWYEWREALRRVDKVFERPLSEISIDDCLFPDVHGPAPVPTFSIILKAMVHDCFSHLLHICLLAMEERGIVLSRVVPHTKQLIVKTWTILFGYEEDELVWNGFLACWIWFLGCLRRGVEMSLYGAQWSFKTSLYGAREKIFPALKTFLAAAYFCSPVLRLLLTNPAAVLRMLREFVSPPPPPPLPRHVKKPVVNKNELLLHLQTKHPDPPRPRWSEDPFVMHKGMKPIRRQDSLWELSPRSRIYPTFA